MNRDAFGHSVYRILAAANIVKSDRVAPSCRRPGGAGSFSYAYPTSRRQHENAATVIGPAGPSSNAARAADAGEKRSEAEGLS
jgi:hypothetical protein